MSNDPRALLSIAQRCNIEGNVSHGTHKGCPFVTDGHILVKLLIGTADSYEAEKSWTLLKEGTADKVLEPIASCEFKPLESFACAEVKQHCLECHGSGRAAKRCPDCEGEGYMECDLGHEHDCERCSGDGTLRSKDEKDPPCIFCIDGKRSKQYVRFSPDGAIFDGRFFDAVNILIPKGARYVEHGDLVYFASDEYHIVVMRVRGGLENLSWSKKQYPLEEGEEQ